MSLGEHGMRTWTVLLAGMVLGAAATLGFSAMLEAPERDLDDAAARLALSGDGTRGAAPAAETTSPVLRSGSLVQEAQTTPDEEAFLQTALTEERRRRRAARILPEDGGIDILRRVLDERADPAELLGSFERFSRHVRTGGAASATFHEPPVGEAIKLGDGAGPDPLIIEFGPGRFSVESNGLRILRGDVSLVEIRGAGMDATTLVLGRRELLMPRANLSNLRLHDLTIDCGEHGSQVLDVRGNTAAILERVRFVGGASGGHSAPIGVSGQCYLGMRDCRFLGGGGGANFAVSLRGGSLVLAEKCLFADLDAAFSGWQGISPLTRVEVVDCDFEGAGIADSRIARDDGRPWYPVIVRGARAAIGPASMSAQERARRFGLQYVASGAETVSLGPDSASATIGLLLQVAEGAQVDRGAVAFAVRMLSPAREATPATYQLDTWDETSGPRAWRIDWRDGRADTRPGRGGTYSPPPPDVLSTTGSIAVVMKNSKADARTEAHALVLRMGQLRPDAPGVQGPVVHVEGPNGDLIETVDARTGEAWRPPGR